MRHSPLLRWIIRLALANPRSQRRAERLLLRAAGPGRENADVRAYLRSQYGVEVGAYSYGPVLNPGTLPRGTVVGRWCSVGVDLRVFRRNHPMDRVSMHPLFYNSALGLVETDTIESDDENPLVVGHGVWIGERVIVLPGCRRIGNGAVVGAGAVVTRDVQAYEIVGGNPAQHLGQRFSDEAATLVDESRWWDRSAEDLSSDLRLMLQPVSSLHVDSLKSPH